MSSFSIGGCLRRVAPALLLVAVADACGPLRRGGQPPTLLIFSNQSLDQAAVYVAASGLDFRRIGTVFGGQTDTLTVPADVATRGGTVNIVARLLARSDIPQTGPVPISPGQQYQVTLPPNGRLLSILPAGS